MPRLALLFLLPMLAAESAAQGVSIAPMSSQLRHDVLSDRVGVLAGFALPVAPRLSLRMELDHSRGTKQRFGSMCVGLINPQLPPCVQESIEDWSEAYTVGIGAGIDVLARRKFSMTLIPQGILGRRRVTSTGESTREQLMSTRHAVGVAFGLEGSWRPLPASRFAVVAGARRALFAASLVKIEDGYDPLSGAFAENGLYLGARFGR